MEEVERQRVLAAASRAISEQLPHAWAAYVYGSFARGDARPDSDLDLAVLLEPGEILSDKLSLSAKLSSAASHEVDLVDLREANLDLIHALLREGRPLFVRRADEVLAWEAERMSDYAEFNPRRQDILSLYLKEPLRKQQ